MITVKLMGGLGNQMFQYAAALAASLDRKGCPLYADLQFLREMTCSSDIFTAREYELGVFPALRTLPEEPGDIRSRRQRKGLRRLFSPKWRVVRQNNAEWVKFPRRSRHLYLDGYFQGERYFGRHAQAVRDAFAMPAPEGSAAGIAAQIASVPEALSVHIRRGDYTKPAVAKTHGIMPPEYYASAWQDLCDRLTVPPAVFVFSDDPAWAQANCLFPGAPSVTFVEGHEGREAWRDMQLMSLCRHHIVANSSFSWWGAWLGAPGGINYAPRHWFAPGAFEYDITCFIPREWHTVDF